MKQTVITIDALSSKSIKNAIKELRQYKKTFKNKVAEFGYRIASEGYKDVQVQIQSMGAVDTGALLNSLYIGSKKQWANGKAIYYIVADSEYACFVEFGSGYKGKDNPYPYDFPKGAKRWRYASGEQVTANAKQGLYGWFYPTDDGVMWTEGQPSRPFMSRSFEELASQVELIAREVFNG